MIPWPLTIRLTETLLNFEGRSIRSNPSRNRGTSRVLIHIVDKTACLDVAEVQMPVALGSPLNMKSVRTYAIYDVSQLQMTNYD